MLLVGVVPEQTLQVQAAVQGLSCGMDAEAVVRHGHAQFLSAQSPWRKAARIVSPRAAHSPRQYQLTPKLKVSVTDLFWY